MGEADGGGPVACVVVDGSCRGLGHFGVEVVKIGGWMRWMEADGGVDGRLIMVGVGGVVHAVWDRPVIGEAGGQKGVAAYGPVEVVHDGAGDGAGGKVGMDGVVFGGDIGVGMELGIVGPVVAVPVRVRAVGAIRRLVVLLLLVEEEDVDSLSPLLPLLLLLSCW